VSAARDPSAANNAQYAKAVPTDLTLLIFAFIYELVLVYDALRSQNTIQIIGICMMNFGILIYTGIQIDQVHTAVDMLSSLHFLSLTFWDQIRGYLVALPCLVCLGTTFMTFLAWKLYEEFGWSIYKQIGADLRMKRCYLLYQVPASSVAKRLLTNSDLHCYTEVRLFPLCRFHRAVSRHRAKHPTV
jgi:hypothetical protein